MVSTYAYEFLADIQYSCYQLVLYLVGKSDRFFGVYKKPRLNLLIYHFWGSDQNAHKSRFESIYFLFLWQEISSQSHSHFDYTILRSVWLENTSQVERETQFWLKSTLTTKSSNSNGYSKLKLRTEYYNIWKFQTEAILRIVSVSINQKIFQ